jgi:hypothetical protein
MSFGQMGFRPNEIPAKWVSAKRAFGQTSFGQTRLAHRQNYDDFFLKINYFSFFSVCG